MNARSANEVMAVLWRYLPSVQEPSLFCLEASQERARAVAFLVASSILTSARTADVGSHNPSETAAISQVRITLNPKIAALPFSCSCHLSCLGRVQGFQSAFCR